MKVIYLYDAMEKVDSIVKEVGREYAYERLKLKNSSVSCLYWHPSSGTKNPDHNEIVAGQPGCIVGRVLHEFGMSPTAISSLDGRGSITTCAKLTEPHGVRLTPAAVQFLQQVQFQQDRGVTWAEAAAYASGYMSAAVMEEDR